MGNEEIIKDFYGTIIGYIQTKSNGDKIALNFYRQILGYYIKTTNVTQNFYRQVIARGDALSGLVWSEYEKEKAKKK